MRKFSGKKYYIMLQKRIGAVLPGSYVEGNGCFRDVSLLGPVPSGYLS
jgi:hypothetical protein